MFRYTKKTLTVEIITILAAAILLLPFWILLMGSLKSLPEVLSSPAVAPRRIRRLTPLSRCFRQPRHHRAISGPVWPRA